MGQKTMACRAQPHFPGIYFLFRMCPFFLSSRLVRRLCVLSLILLRKWDFQRGQIATAASTVPTPGLLLATKYMELHMVVILPNVLRGLRKWHLLFQFVNTLQTGLILCCFSIAVCVCAHA